MTAALERVAHLVQDETGITLGQAQLSSLAAAMKRVDPSLDADAFLRAGTDRREGRELLDRLIDEVTVNETFLFRERRELDAIDWRGLVESARASGRGTARVWVAACSSGEEAYTLAMLASDAFGSATPPISILATDISAAILEKARRACYGRRATRLLDPQTRKRYFVEVEGGVEVAPAIRELVEFQRHNLVSDPLPAPGPSSFDLIACRNVLIYFDGDTVERVIGSLERALARGGMLLLGAADRLCGSARRLGRPDPQAPRPARQAPARELRRPLGRPAAEPAPRVTPLPRVTSSDGGLAAALRAANEGSLEATLELTERLLDEDPLDADAYFVRGLAELGLGDAEAAAASLRRALYVDPAFGLAAFQLGRAHDERGDRTAAARAYDQALRTLDGADGRHEAILDQVDLGDVAAACGMRLRALRGAA